MKTASPVIRQHLGHGRDRLRCREATQGLDGPGLDQERRVAGQGLAHQGQALRIADAAQGLGADSALLLAIFVRQTSGQRRSPARITQPSEGFEDGLAHPAVLFRPA